MTVRTKIITLFVLVIILIISQLFFDIATYFKVNHIKEWLSATGVFAPLVYMLIMALAVIISPIPSLPLDIAAGAFFGPLLGTVYSVVGASIGALISFSIARHLGREFIERFLGGHVNFCIECSDKLLTKIVFFSRLLPIISFDIISYGAGLTKMSLKNFTLATFLGMIPLTFIYNYSGSVLVFGKGITVILGLIMVILFFVIPKWIEQKEIYKKMTPHCHDISQK